MIEDHWRRVTGRSAPSPSAFEAIVVGLEERIRPTGDAVGKLADKGDGELAVTQVVLHPRIDFNGTPPTAEELARLHELAHKHCFIANSVTTEIRVEPA